MIGIREPDTALLDEVERIARGAGNIVKAHYVRGTPPWFKSARQVATLADGESEQWLRDELLRLHSCAFHGEECGGEIAAQDDQWVVDPLDGTENMSGYPPLVGISIGLLRDGNPVLGVICDPLHDVLYSACEGGPARVNGRAAAVSLESHAGRALIGLDFSSKMETRFRTLEQMACVLKQARAVKILGAPALSLAAVAAGRLDLFFRPASKPADLAAGVCLVRAAGGSAVDFDGADWTIRSKGILAGPKRMVEAYLPCFTSRPGC